MFLNCSLLDLTAAHCLVTNPLLNLLPLMGLTFYWKVYHTWEGMGSTDYRMDPRSGKDGCHGCHSHHRRLMFPMEGELSEVMVLKDKWICPHQKWSKYRRRGRGVGGE